MSQYDIEQDSAPEEVSERVDGSVDEPAADAEPTDAAPASDAEAPVEATDDVVADDAVADDAVDEAEPADEGLAVLAEDLPLEVVDGELGDVVETTPAESAPDVEASAVSVVSSASVGSSATTSSTGWSASSTDSSRASWTGTGVSSGAVSCSMSCCDTSTPYLSSGTCR